MPQRPTHIRPHPEGCTLTLRIHPGAKRNAIAYIHNGALKISLTAPAVDGKANAALIAYLAEVLNLPKSSLTLLHGLTSRSKTLKITGTEADIILERLAKASA